MSTPILDATSFWGLLTARHESSPDHPLLIDDAGRSLTVAEFVTEVEQVAVCPSPPLRPIPFPLRTSNPERDAQHFLVDRADG